MKIKFKEIFESLYDTYSLMVYGIAFEISGTEKEAKKILISVYRKLLKNNLIRQNSHCLCALLIKLTIQTAQKQSPQKNLTLNLFKNTPLLHELLYEKMNLVIYCKKNNMIFTQAMLKIREEFKELINHNFHNEVI